MNYEELHSIFYQQEAQHFVGLQECHYFDAKSQPYVFNKDVIKHEFAKDVVSFLNAEGGFILLGGVTEKVESQSIEKVSALSWFPAKLVNIRQYYDLISEWIYPEPDGIDILAINGDGDEVDKQLVVIAIPNQAPAKQPYLIAKCMPDTDGKVDSHLIGYAKRFLDGTKRLERKDIHKWIQSGQLFEIRMAERFDQLVDLIEKRGEVSLPPANELSQFVPKRVEAAVAHLEAQDQRYLSVVFYPSNPISLSTIFESRRSPIVNLMTNPPELRETGWDVFCGFNPRSIGGEFLRNGESNRRVLDVYPDGTVVFVALINEDLLAWGSKSGSRVHPLALTETLWGISAFYRELVKHFEKEPVKVAFQLELQNLMLDGVPTTLPPYHVGSMSFHDPFEHHEADDKTYLYEAHIDCKDFAAEIVAYLLLRAIYLRFNFTEAEIPYVTEIDGKKALNTSEMVKPVN
jgi:hypothetical protein